MRVRNYLSQPSNQREEAEEEEEDSRAPGRSSSPTPPTEHDELLVDLRNFVAFQANVDGQATTQEVLEYFKPRLTQQQAPVFRELLRSICDFHRTSGQEGIWRLKENFRWVVAAELWCIMNTRLLWVLRVQACNIYLFFHVFLIVICCFLSNCHVCAWSHKRIISHDSSLLRKDHIAWKPLYCTMIYGLGDTL